MGGKSLNLGGILIGPAAFRPRAHTSAAYTPSIEKGRPVLQGLLAIDFLAKEASYHFPSLRKFAGSDAVISMSQSNLFEIKLADLKILNLGVWVGSSNA